MNDKAKYKGYVIEYIIDDDDDAVKVIYTVRLEHSDNKPIDPPISSYCSPDISLVAAWIDLGLPMDRRPLNREDIEQMWKEKFPSTKMPLVY